MSILKAPKDFFLFQTQRLFSSLCKHLLIILEDQLEDHKTMIDKLYTYIPADYHKIIQSADYFNNKKFEYMRKKTLSQINDCKRELENHFEKLVND